MSATEPLEYYKKHELETLQNQNVIIPSLDHVCISKDVPLENIGEEVTLHPFCRISGAKTKIFPKAQIGTQGAVVLENSVIGSESMIGQQGPVTLINTWTGPNTVLGSGVAEHAVFLGKESFANDFTTGFGFRVRKGSLYEEDSSSAQHTDTKMSILFPWVTLGSNVNLCDLLLTGGTGPELGKFTEVGSGTIHFNFTIRGDKATASLFGNVSQGAFLQEKRLFIGGNNSILGPLQADFGTFTAAGIRAAGNLKEGLNLGRGLPIGHMDYDPKVFKKAKSIVEQQVHYIGQLVALYHWYQEVRFYLAQSKPEHLALYQAGQQIITLNIRERIAQIERVINNLSESIHTLKGEAVPQRATIEEQENLIKQWPSLKAHLENFKDHFWEIPERLLGALESNAAKHKHYTQIIQYLSSDSVDVGVTWLESIVHRCEHGFKNELELESK